MRRLPGRAAGLRPHAGRCRLCFAGRSAGAATEIRPPSGAGAAVRPAAARRRAGRGSIALPALLCSVPLGPRRLAGRGYNQALEIARPLARGLGIALAPQLLHRVRETAAQSSVAPERRQQNIAGAFAVPDAALVAGRHIGVVDDVMTSGRTLNEVAATLKRHGAARVSNFVFARTPPH
ncbi:ComF family protein [Duganella dendranthematis]|uniref:ComF family protein n=1 Tax=Duganella dendranthematis TaxID=2728021 RepID=UPI0035314AEE